MVEVGWARNATPSENVRRQSEAEQSEVEQPGMKVKQVD